MADPREVGWTGTDKCLGYPRGITDDHGYGRTLPLPARACRQDAGRFAGITEDRADYPRQTQPSPAQWLPVRARLSSVQWPPTAVAVLDVSDGLHGQHDCREPLAFEEPLCSHFRSSSSSCFGSQRPRDDVLVVNVPVMLLARVTEHNSSSRRTKVGSSGLAAGATLSDHLIRPTIFRGTAGCRLGPIRGAVIPATHANPSGCRLAEGPLRAGGQAPPV